MTENEPGGPDRPGGADRPARPAEQAEISLNLLPPEILRRRALSIALGALIIGAGFGGLFGLIGGRDAGLVAAGVIIVPFLLLAWSESRRRTRLAGRLLSVSTFGTRTVDLGELREIDLLVSDQRGMRTVALLIRAGRRTVTVALALYAGAGGRELGILELRRLADVLAGIGDTRTLALSQLLVAQLRAEARGEPAANRPLYQIASAAPGGRFPTRLDSAAVARFVATLDY
ncbi:hypothetical protein FHR81_000588 [Actinoalloteichus hoggarensis]|uniref:Uncharacterized protein n=1 Tax=Actinoalloteichus hoggarensis TaxID=1470176 RepID=A0A221W1M7_9PSEU|nr:hypothetical protein [Actinoalloteichus hoggarensis]ASO19735.1 hypothetical protein AHOG_10460 [Actinoalloteichus hoggarensis]MBB5919559.1 hypothetical protein [Actinoalloteichus hoggarensis]